MVSTKFRKVYFCIFSTSLPQLLICRTSTPCCINVCPRRLYLQWSTTCCSHHILVLVVMYSHLSTALAVSSLVLGLVLSQEGSGSLPAGHEEILAYPYVDSFSCEGQAYGYYADVDSGCQVGRRKKEKKEEDQ